MISAANLSQCAAVLELQKEAYQSEALLYPGLELPPLVQSLEQLEQELKTHQFLVYIEAGQVIGSVRAKRTGKEWEIGRLIVKPTHQGQGIGSRLLKAIEQTAPPECTQFSLFTGHKSQRNLTLYQSKGYVPTAEEVLDPTLTLIVLTKEINVRST